MVKSKKCFSKLLAILLVMAITILSGYNSSSSSASFTYMDPWDGNFYTSNIVSDGTFTFISDGYLYTLVNYLHLN